MTKTLIAHLVRWLLIHSDLKRNVQVYQHLEELRFTLFLLRYEQASSVDSLLWAWLRCPRPVVRFVAWNWHSDVLYPLGACTSAAAIGVAVGYLGNERLVVWLVASIIAGATIWLVQVLYQDWSDACWRWTINLSRRRSARYQLDPRLPLLQELAELLQQPDGPLAEGFVQFCEELNEALQKYGLGQRYDPVCQIVLRQEAQYFLDKLHILQTKNHPITRGE